MEQVTLTDAERASYEHVSYPVPHHNDGRSDLRGIQSLLKDLYGQGKFIDPEYLLFGQEDFTRMRQWIGESVHICFADSATEELLAGDTGVFLLNQATATMIRLIQDERLPVDTLLFLYRKEGG